MRAGRRDRRVTLERNTPVQNSTGEEIESWDPIATVWAEVRPAKGAESFQAQQFIGKAQSTFRVLWSSRVARLNVEDRIIYEGKDYGILDVREIGRREGLEIDAFARSELPVVHDASLLLEDGAHFLLENGGYLLLG